MKCVIQRVSEARVRVEGNVVGAIGPGLLLLLCIERGDAAERVRHWARRIPVLRVFNDEQGKMNRSLLDVGGAELVISQFTLTANLHEKGRRPSFVRAEEPGRARELIDLFIRETRAMGVEVASGIFGAMMQVELVNDGPVTFIVDDAVTRDGT